MGFQYPPFQNPQKTHQLEEATTSCTQYDPVEVIAGLRCAPLETEQKNTKEQQQNSNKKTSACMLPVLQRLENPKRCVTFPVKLFAKSQTIKKFSTFRFF